MFIFLQMEPAYIILSPDGKTAYVTNGADNSLTVIDVDSMIVTSTIAVGKAPYRRFSLLSPAALL